MTEMPSSETPVEVARRLWVFGFVDDSGERQYPTLDAIAFEADLPAEDVRNAASAGSWNRHRDAFQRQVRADLRAQHASRVERMATAIDSHALQAAEAGLALIEARTQEVLVAHAKYRVWVEDRARIAAELGIPDDGMAGGVAPVDAGEVRNLAQAAIAYQQIGERALGRVDVRAEVSGVGGAAMQIEHRLESDDDNDRLARLFATLSNSRLVKELPVALELESGD